MTRELEGLEECPKAEIHINLLKTTLNKYQTEKHQTIMEYMVSVSRNSPPFTRNEQMPARYIRIQMCDQRKDHLDPKGSEQKKCPQKTTDP